MNFAIITTRLDPASMSIREHLIKDFSFKETDGYFDGSSVYIKENIKLYTLQEGLLHQEHIDEKVDEDILIFASKHSSKEKVPALTCHVTGNWGTAEHGGKDHHLSMCSARLLKSAFLALSELGKDLPYEKTLETTHHGPLLSKKPSIFIEIGSSEEEWKNPIAAEIIAKAIMQVIVQVIEIPVQKYKVALGFGGTHYASNFNKVLLRTDIALSHICPKHHLEHLSQELVDEAIRKTAEKVDLAVLDWKGLGKYKPQMLQILDRSGLTYIKIR